MSRWVYVTKWPQEGACSSGLPLFSERKRKPEKLENTKLAYKKELHQLDPGQNFIKTKANKTKSQK